MVKRDGAWFYANVGEIQVETNKLLLYLGTATSMEDGYFLYNERVVKLWFGHVEPVEILDNGMVQPLAW